MAHNMSRNCFDFSGIFSSSQRGFLGFLHLLFPAFFPLDREVFWVF